MPERAHECAHCGSNRQRRHGPLITRRFSPGLKKALVCWVISLTRT